MHLSEYVKHNYRPWHHTLFAPMIEGFTRLGNTSFEVEGEVKSQGVKVHVGRHTSHKDYLETQLALHRQGKSCLTCMGDNLNIGLIGRVFKWLGAFSAIREETELGGRTVKMDAARQVFREYLQKVLVDEGQDVLIYPEYTRQDGKVKYGRSYTGAINRFSPYVFHVLKTIQANTGAPIYILPHNASRERVVEDELFQKLTTMTGASKYLYDLAQTALLSLAQKPGRVKIRFGEPIELANHSTREITKLARKSVARLGVLYPTHVMASAIGQDTEITKQELAERVKQEAERLPNCEERDWRTVLDKGWEQFNQPRHRAITPRAGRVRVNRPDIIQQYANTAKSVEEACDANL